MTFWQRTHFDDFAWKCALVFGAVAAVIGLGGLVACAQVPWCFAAELFFTIGICTLSSKSNVRERARFKRAERNKEGEGMSKAEGMRGGKIQGDRHVERVGV